MTSLPAHEALFHMSAKIVQRSRGKSAVAAAAYRAGARLTDARTGSTWDYSRKRHVLDSFMTGPAGAPAWALDRETLWSRAELAELRKNSQTAREIEISIPRDLQPAAWRAFLTDVARPYVEAGAVVDTCIHVPPAGDNGINAHAHMLMTCRRLDPDSSTGFAKTRNDALAAIFESGGRRGGTRGDALMAERERVAVVVNSHLRAAGSRRRADHRSYEARGDPRTPEPKMGEQRVAAVRRRRKHDRRSAVVAGIRETRKLDNEITKMEMEMALSARGFARAPARKREPHQQDYKLGLLSDRFPDADLSAVRDALYLVDAKDPRKVRVLMRDGAWVESDDESGTVTMWGPRSASAKNLADAIAVSTGYGVDRLEKSASAGKPKGNKRKQAMPEAEAVSLADKWRRRGYVDVTEGPAGVRVGLGSRSRLLDSGEHIDLVGPVCDVALRALATKAAEDWSGSLSLDGPWPEDAIGRLWLECQRQGVNLVGYEPTPELAAAWAAESAKISDSATKLRAVRSETKEADLVLAAASGDVAALRRLDPDLRAFVQGHLDDDQRADLAKADREEVTASLPAFRGLGKAELERDPTAASIVAQPTADPAPSADYERRPT